MAQRIKGQETQIIISRGGVLEDTLTNIPDFEVVDKFELITKGYLGQKTDLYDEIFKGTTFKLTMHLNKKQWFLFRQAMRDRAQRVTPSVIFNISTVLNFPNGDTKAETLPDVKFGELPSEFPSRDEYIQVTLQGGCEGSTFQDL